MIIKVILKSSNRIVVVESGLKMQLYPGHLLGHLKRTGGVHVRGHYGHAFELLFTVTKRVLTIEIDLEN